MKKVSVGLLFSVLWASAAVATKFGVAYAPPLVLANLRFFIAGIILLLFGYAFRRDQEYRMPSASEFKQLAVFGLLNTTVYLGLYVFAMKYTAAGIGSLAVSTNPLIIVVLSAFYLKRRPSKVEVFSIFLGIAGIVVATVPLLRASYGTLGGFALLFASMLAVSCASVYYASIHWKLPNLLINGWQVLLGCIFLIPFTLLVSDFDKIVFNRLLIFSILWLSLAVSVIGLICWFYLLRIDAVKASLWLFLCPLFGFFYAWWLIGEPVTIYTIAGTALVVVALYLGQRTNFRNKNNNSG